MAFSFHKNSLKTFPINLNKKRAKVGGKKIENDQVSQLDLNGWGRVKGVKKWGLKKIKWVDGNKEVQRVLTHFREKKITLWHVQVKLFTGTWKSCIVQIFYTFCKVKYFDTNRNTHIENPSISSPCCLWTPCNFFRETASIFLTRRDLQSVLLCRRQNLLVVSLSCTKGGFSI